MARKKIDETAVVRANREVAPGFWRLSLKAPQIASGLQPGQFFQLRIHPDGQTPLLRRPFAPSEVSESGFAFVYAVVGQGTTAMTRLGKGARVQVLGPLGHGYRLPRPGSRSVLVGGGCGTPSLRFLAEALVERNVEVYSVIGAQTACTLLERSALKRLSVLQALSTDDGTAGFHGHAVDATRVLLEEMGRRPKPVLFGCGPQAMLRGLADLAGEQKLRCYVSLEERMACGFGACMGCAVAISDSDGVRYKRVCVDGPVFDVRQLVWPEDTGRHVIV